MLLFRGDLKYMAFGNKKYLYKLGDSYALIVNQKNGRQLVLNSIIQYPKDELEKSVKDIQESIKAIKKSIENYNKRSKMDINALKEVKLQRKLQENYLAEERKALKKLDKTYPFKVISDPTQKVYYGQDENLDSGYTPNKSRGVAVEPGKEVTFEQFQRFYKENQSLIIEQSANAFLSLNGNAFREILVNIGLDKAKAMYEEERRAKELEAKKLNEEEAEVVETYDGVSEKVKKKRSKVGVKFDLYRRGEDVVQRGVIQETINKILSHSKLYQKIKEKESENALEEQRKLQLKKYKELKNEELESGKNRKNHQDFTVRHQGLKLNETSKSEGTKKVGSGVNLSNLYDGGGVAARIKAEALKKQEKEMAKAKAKAKTKAKTKKERKEKKKSQELQQK